MKTAKQPRIEADKIEAVVANLEELAKEEEARMSAQSKAKTASEIRSIFKEIYFILALKIIPSGPIQSSLAMPAVYNPIMHFSSRGYLLPRKLMTEYLGFADS